MRTLSINVLLVIAGFVSSCAPFATQVARGHRTLDVHELAVAPAADGPARNAVEAAAWGNTAADAAEPTSVGGALAPAALQTPGTSSRADRNFIRGGLGFMIDPDAFLLSFEGGRYLAPNLAVGPLVQLGVADHRTVVAPTVNVQYAFDLPGDDAVRNLKPFVQGGLGFAYIHKDRGVGDDDDVGFLLNLGFGFEYDISDSVSLGSNMLFNILPDETNGENFFFSWQVVTVAFRF